MSIEDLSRDDLDTFHSTVSYLNLDSCVRQHAGARHNDVQAYGRRREPRKPSSKTQDNEMMPVIVIEDNTDYPGNDIRSTTRASAEECLLDCHVTPDCKLFVFNGQECWLKHTKGERRVWPGAQAGMMDGIQYLEEEEKEETKTHVKVDTSSRAEQPHAKTTRDEHSKEKEGWKSRKMCRMEMEEKMRKKKKQCKSRKYRQ